MHQPGRHSRRRIGTIAPIVVALVVLSVGASGALASILAQAKTGSQLAVSVPAEPVVLAPGKTTTLQIRVLNPGTRAVTVTITGRRVDLQDNGAVTIGDGPDPLWKDRVRFPGKAVTIKAQNFVNVDLTVTMPAAIDPDLYFVGFLVRPVTPSGGSVKVINEIGSFVTLDVPGPRVRKLAAELELTGMQIPGVLIGSNARGTLQVKNVGATQVRFWGEIDTSSTPGGGPHQQRIEKSLIPRSHIRTFTVGDKSNRPIGFLTITAHIIYPSTTEASTKEIVLTKRVLVISPWFLIALFLLLFAAIAFWIFRRRRRRALNTPKRRAPAKQPA